MKRSRTLAAIAALAAAAGALAGCAKDDAAPGGSGGDITVAFIGSTESQVYSFPESSAAAKARFAAVNDAGGVNGRKINFTSCNDKADPNEAAACVRKAAQDKAVAVIGGISAVGDALTGALESAKIVYTGNRPLSPGELHSAVAFPLVGGGASTAGGAGLYAVNTLKCKSIYVIDGDVPGNRTVAAAFKAGVKAASGKEPGETVTPATSSDYAPAAAAAASAGADCVYYAISVPEMPKAIPAFRRALPGATLITSSGNLPGPIIKALGADAEGFVLSDSQIPVTTKGNAYLDQFHAEMTKYTPDATQSAFALSSWMGADLLVKVLQGMSGDVSAASVLDAYRKLGAVQGHGVIGDFAFSDKGAVPDAPRLFNVKYTVVKVVKGEPTLEGAAEFGDATPALQH
ncbi:ABC transporter substrate-binding protein [Dactylosporangium sp. NPDC048998]|uniref:ABC transporter substrate-binding protein n=1 Tax=Dactylosporangium sp. NPDC048998 TaxID=3363976 RepID=UPI00371BEAB8